MVDIGILVNGKVSEAKVTIVGDLFLIVVPISLVKIFSLCHSAALHRAVTLEEGHEALKALALAVDHYDEKLHDEAITDCGIVDALLLKLGFFLAVEITSISSSPRYKPRGRPPTISDEVYFLLRLLQIIYGRCSKRALAKTFVDRNGNIVLDLILLIGGKSSISIADETEGFDHSIAGQNAEKSKRRARFGMCLSLIHTVTSRGDDDVARLIAEKQDILRLFVDVVLSGMKCLRALESKNQQKTMEAIETETDTALLILSSLAVKVKDNLDIFPSVLLCFGWAVLDESDQRKIEADKRRSLRSETPSERALVISSVRSALDLIFCISRPSSSNTVEHIPILVQQQSGPSTSTEYGALNLSPNPGSLAAEQGNSGEIQKARNTSTADLVWCPRELGQQQTLIALLPNHSKDTNVRIRIIAPINSEDALLADLEKRKSFCNRKKDSTDTDQCVKEKSVSRVENLGHEKRPFWLMSTAKDQRKPTVSGLIAALNNTVETLNDHRESCNMEDDRPINIYFHNDAPAAIAVASASLEQLKQIQSDDFVQVQALTTLFQQSSLPDAINRHLRRSAIAVQRQTDLSLANLHHIRKILDLILLLPLLTIHLVDSIDGILTEFLKKVVCLYKSLIKKKNVSCCENDSCDTDEESLIEVFSLIQRCTGEYDRSGLKHFPIIL